MSPFYVAPFYGVFCFYNCSVWCQTCGLALPWYLFCCRVFAVVVIFVAVFHCCTKWTTTLPWDVLGQVVWGVYLQGVCSSGMLRKQSQHIWCSMPLHMAGSQPGELTILLHSSLSLWLSINVCHSLCFFLFSAPAAPVSLGCCLSLCLSVWLSLSMCAVQMLLTSPANEVPPYFKDIYSLLQLGSYFRSFGHHFYWKCWYCNNPSLHWNSVCNLHLYATTWFCKFHFDTPAA